MVDLLSKGTPMSRNLSNSSNYGVQKLTDVRSNRSIIRYILILDPKTVCVYEIVFVSLGGKGNRRRIVVPPQLVRRCSAVHFQTKKG